MLFSKPRTELKSKDGNENARDFAISGAISRHLAY